MDAAVAALITLAGCGAVDPSGADAGDSADASIDAGPAGWAAYEGPSPFGGSVVSFTPGEAAGFGQDALPDIALGPPDGKGARAGSLDVVSLGRDGVIVLRFDEVSVIDGTGPDLLVFENAFGGFSELARVAVSDDGEAWSEFPCAADDDAGGFPGCAGTAPVHLNATNFDLPFDPAVTGGDAYDLAGTGLSRIRYVRLTDTGTNGYAGTSGGFDLDAIGAIHFEALAP